MIFGNGICVRDGSGILFFAKGNAKARKDLPAGRQVQRTARAEGGSWRERSER